VNVSDRNHYTSQKQRFAWTDEKLLEDYYPEGKNSKALVKKL
jgi:hypothetical protein